MYDGVGLVDQLNVLWNVKRYEEESCTNRSEKWLEYFELEDNKQALKTLSKGNATKIQIIQSVMNDPDILVLMNRLVDLIR